MLPSRSATFKHPDARGQLVTQPRMPRFPVRCCAQKVVTFTRLLAVTTLFKDNITTMISLVGVLTIPLLIGFALGYGAREIISRRRREAARLRHMND